MRYLTTVLALLLLTASPGYAASPPDYLSTSTSTFELRYNLRDSDHVSDVLNMLEQAYQSISREFAMFPLQRFTVSLHTESDFPPATNSRVWAYYRPATKSIHVLYTRPKPGSVGQRRMQRTLTHELSHAFVDVLMGSPRCPRWFKEGLATYIESTDAERGRRRARAHLAARAGTFASFETAPYDSGAIAVDYLMNRVSPASVRQLVDEMQAGHPFSNALTTVTGLESTEFERAVREWLLLAWTGEGTSTGEGLSVPLLVAERYAAILEPVMTAIAAATLDRLETRIGRPVTPDEEQRFIAVVLDAARDLLPVGAVASAVEAIVGNTYPPDALRVRLATAEVLKRGLGLSPPRDGDGGGAGEEFARRRADVVRHLVTAIQRRMPELTAEEGRVAARER